MLFEGLLHLLNFFVGRAAKTRIQQLTAGYSV
jgi:hypothetical protein